MSRPLTAEEILANTDGARRLIRFRQAVEAGEIPDQHTLEELAAAFRSIDEGERPEQALGLTNPRGRPKRTGRDDDRELAEHRDELFAVLERKRCNMTLDAAIGAVAAEFGVNEDTLRDRWKRHHKTVKLLEHVQRSVRQHRAAIDSAERKLAFLTDVAEAARRRRESNR